MSTNNWSLKELYDSHDSKEFENDLESLKNQISDFTKWADSIKSTSDNPIDIVEAYLEKSSNIVSLSSKLYTFSSLSFATESKNSKAVGNMNLLMGLMSDSTYPKVVFKKYLNNLGKESIEKLTKQSDIISEHRFHLNEILKHSEHMLGEKEEVILSKMKNTSSNAWETLQNKSTSSLMVDIELDGEIKSLPLQVVRNYGFSKDKDLRKKAYEAELKSYDKICEISASALNSIKGEVIFESDIRNFTSPLEKTLFDARMDKKTLDAMLEAIKNYLPKFREYYKRKGEILGNKNGLPFYDLFAPVGNSNMKFTYDDAKEFIVSNFNTFSKNLGDFAHMAFDKNWVDVEPKEGKRGGAFCSNIRPIKESRFLVNFTGDLNNVVTLAHELGHGYHGHNIFEENILNCTYPMPLAETASIFCETIVKKAALKKADADEALAILEASIQGYGQVIVDIYSRYMFETELFNRRAESTLSVDEINDIMLKCQLEAYGDGLDPEYLHKFMWVNKVHYYYAARNFYNFPYAFGLLFAKGLYNLYLTEGDEFVKKYDHMLRATGKMSIEDVAKLMNIDVTDSKFWEASLSEIAGEIDSFLELSK